jgi:hypothetical protein
MPSPCLLVNYLGFRVLISLQLPVGPRVFGKSGDEPPDKSPDYNEDVCNAVSTLLEPIGLRKGKSYKCVLPFDAEGFKSLEDFCSSEPLLKDKCHNLYFVVDLARALPPASGERYLSQLFRKEFVRYYYAVTKKQLNCDEKVDTEAVEFYFREIPNLAARHLKEVQCRDFYEDLVFIVHFNGLNLRDISHVYLLLKEEDLNEAAWRRRIVVEVCARSFRRVIETALKSRVEQGKVVESETKMYILSFFTAALVDSDSEEIKKKKEDLWNSMNKWKNECFPYSTGKVEEGGGCAPVYGNPDTTAKPEGKGSSDSSQDGSGWRNLRLSEACIYATDDYLLEVFLVVTGELLGITWNPKLWDKIRDRETFRKTPFSYDLIQDLHPRVLELNIASHARGVVAMDARRDYEESLRQLRHALDRQPTNEHTLDRYARACEKCAIALEERHPGSEEARILREKRKHWIRKACELPDPHPDTYFSRGFLEMEEADRAEGKDERSKKLKEAQNFFASALEKNPNHSYALFMLEYVKFIQDPHEYRLEDMEPEKWKGNNGKYHLFFFLLREQKWVEAAEVAKSLQKRITDRPENKRSGYDNEMLTKINEFMAKCRTIRERMQE